MPWFRRTPQGRSQGLPPLGLLPPPASGRSRLRSTGHASGVGRWARSEVKGQISARRAGRPRARPHHHLDVPVVNGDTTDVGGGLPVGDALLVQLAASQDEAWGDGGSSLPPARKSHPLLPSTNASSSQKQGLASRLPLRGGPDRGPASLVSFLQQVQRQLPQGPRTPPARRWRPRLVGRPVLQLLSAQSPRESGQLGPAQRHPQHSRDLSWLGHPLDTAGAPGPGNSLPGCGQGQAWLCVHTLALATENGHPTRATSRTRWGNGHLFHSQAQDHSKGGRGHTCRPKSRAHTIV